MKIRIDNIELRVTDIGYHIIKWYTNEYYGAEERMIAEGYEKVDTGNGEWCMRRDWTSIHASCFKNPESCYTIARLEYFAGEGCCELTTVGTRVLDLKKADRKTFFKVYRLAERAIRELNRDIDDEY